MEYAFRCNLKTMGIVHKPTAFSITALIVNTFFNWVLIYGALGFPELGIQGAAYATLFARMIQTLLLLQLLYKEKLVGRKTYGVQKNHGFSRKYFALTLPSIFNHLTWTWGTSPSSISSPRWAPMKLQLLPLLTLLCSSSSASIRASVTLPL